MVQTELECPMCESHSTLMRQLPNIPPAVLIFQHRCEGGPGVLEVGHDLVEVHVVP